MLDTVIIGAGPAGLAAALTLGRMKRSVLIADTGTPRNEGAEHMHNFFSRDGDNPAEVRERARRDLDKYDTVRMLDAAVTHVTGQRGDFTVQLGDETVTTRRILITTGLIDSLPDIPGLTNHWGTSVFHCPYCHGFETAGKRTAILAAGAGAARLALMLARYGSPLTVLTQGEEFEPALATALAEAEIAVDHRAIARVDGAEHPVFVFDDGDTLEAEAVFAHTAFRQQSDLAERLGCVILPSGCVEIDHMGRTSVPGVLAAGDAAHRAELPGPMAAVIMAAASGTTAATLIDQDLLSDDIGMPHPF